ncbi:unnamed protein product, partial [Amoebophrya sp. A25]
RGASPGALTHWRTHSAYVRPRTKSGASIPQRTNGGTRTTTGRLCETHSNTKERGARARLLSLCVSNGGEWEPLRTSRSTVQRLRRSSRLPRMCQRCRQNAAG